MSDERKDNKRNLPGGRPRGMGGRMGGQGMAMMGAKSKDFKGAMLGLLECISEYRLKIIIVIIFAVCSTVFSIVSPKILGNVTTKLVDGMIAYAMGTGFLTDFRYISNRILLLVVLYLISALFSYVQAYIMSDVSMKITYRFRKDISEKINRLPLSYYDKQTHGEVLSRITNDIDTISQTLNQSMTQIITSVTMVLGIIVMMISISWLMTLATVLMLPLSSIFIMLVVKRSQKHFRRQQEYLGHLNGHVEEVYTGHNLVQVFNRENAVTETFNGYNDELYKAAWKSQFLSGLMMPIMNIIGNISFVVICILGGYLAVKSNLKIGDIQAFIQYSRSFMQPVTQMANISNVLQSTAAAAERVFEFLNEPEESRDFDAGSVSMDEKRDGIWSDPVKNPATHTEIPTNISNNIINKSRTQDTGFSLLNKDSVKGEVVFDCVHFGYTPEKIIINDFSTAVAPGRNVAIVGPTGAGKTTIVKLLMRFYELNSGVIYVDGYNIANMPRKALRGLFGMVLQDTWLYNATIMENIRYGSFDKDDKDVKNAAIAACCDEFIHQLPGGYNMVINEDATNISQGQKQLLTIARTFLADPPILILDEATSSVDTRTEALVQRAMARLLHGRTSFIIAHRLSTIRDADVILVMKDGDIIEQGSHRDLLAADGFYADLYMSQFENRDSDN